MKKIWRKFAAIAMTAVMLTTGVQLFGGVFAEDPAVADTNVEAVVTLDNRYQEIEGFGFFGSMDPWWMGSDPSHFYTDEWLDMVINDMGISMWRNELYPNNPIKSTTSTSNQDANWDKQKEMVAALAKKAKESGKELKVILTVWSPPGEFKTTGKFDYVSQPGAERGTEIINNTKGGGTLSPAKYKEYADWWISGLDMYKEIGVDVYAISLQNEPAFEEPYNSCVYTSEWYIELVNNVAPLIKEKYPNVKIFGAENMLSAEAGATEYGSNYHWKFIKNEDFLKNFDVFAYHGYVDGVAAAAVASHKDLWGRAYELYSKPTGKPQWMTETSGYYDHWLTTADKKPGALELAQAVNIALSTGKASAWVMWQGSAKGTNAQDEFSIMDGTKVGKRYHVLKQFYKFIRPGAKMVNVKTSSDDVVITAFHNEKEKTFSSVLVNQTDKAQKVVLSGANLPAKYEYYITNGDKDVDCVKKDDVTGNVIDIPAYSVVTLNATDFNYTPAAYTRIESMKFSKSKVTVAPKKSVALSLEINPAEATNQKVVYTSSNENIATVDENGKVTAKKIGKCTITATADENGQTASCSIKVANLAKKIVLKKKSLTVKVKKKAKIKYTVTPKNTTNKKVSFKSSNKKVAKVNAKGVVTGVKKGKAVITIKTKDGSGKSAKCKIKVVK